MPSNSYSYSHVSIFQNAVSVWNMQMIGELQGGYETDGLMQERRHSIANALGLRFSCTNSSRQGCAIYKSEADFGQICCDAKTPSVERYFYSPEWIHTGLVKKAAAVSCPVHQTSHILCIDFVELECAVGIFAPVMSDISPPIAVLLKDCIVCDISTLIISWFLCSILDFGIRQLDPCSCFWHHVSRWKNL